MRTLVHKPLCSLRDLLAGPRNLIRKRLDKLLDYEQICDKSSLSYEEQAVANTYRWTQTETQTLSQGLHHSDTRSVTFSDPSCSLPTGP